MDHNRAETRHFPTLKVQIPQMLHSISPRRAVGPSLDLRRADLDGKREGGPEGGMLARWLAGRTQTSIGVTSGDESG